MADSGSNKTTWIGPTRSGPALLFFVFALAIALLTPEMVAHGFAHYNYPPNAPGRALAAERMGSLLVYTIPQTSISVARFLAANLGAAAAAHLPLGEPFFLPVRLGILLWLGVFFLEPRLRDFVPLRRRNR